MLSVSVVRLHILDYPYRKLQMTTKNDGRLIKELYEHFVNLFFAPNVDEKEIKAYLSSVTAFVPEELHVLL